MKAHAIAASLLLWASSAEIVSAQKSGAGWKEYLGGPDSSHYSPLKQINRSNVGKLEVAWSYETGDNGVYFFSPLVVDNIAYVAAKQGALVALDAATGKELWVHSFPAAAGRGGGRGGGIAGQRGANYWESKDRSDRRIFVTTGGFLHAIDARTGKTVDSFADHGKLDLKTGIDRTTIPLASRTPGRIFENLIILGSATGEGYLPPPGDIRAFDVRTGKLAWVFHTIPRPGEFGYDTWPKDAYKYMGGVDVWGEITVDEKRGIVYLPTASAKYELYGGDRPAIISSPIACWRSTRERGNTCGISRPFTTISGTTIPRPLPNWRPSNTTARASISWRSQGRTVFFTYSTASRESRFGRSKSGPSRSRMCLASGRRPPSPFRPFRLLSPART